MGLPDVLTPKHMSFARPGALWSCRTKSNPPYLWVLVPGLYREEIAHPVYGLLVVLKEQGEFTLTLLSPPPECAPALPEDRESWCHIAGSKRSLTMGPNAECTKMYKCAYKLHCAPGPKLYHRPVSMVSAARENQTHLCNR